MKYFLGLDVAKESFYAVLLDAAGETIFAQSFTNDAAGFTRLAQSLPQPDGTLALCEPTGAYGKRMQQALTGVVASMHELNAQSLQRFAFSQVRTKTDEADALAIARAARTLYLSEPKKLENCRVSRDLPREDLALWLAEFARLRSAIAMLKVQLQDVEQQVAPAAARVKQLRAKELKRLQEAQRNVTQEIEQAFQQLDDRQGQLLDSIPGVGLLTAATALVVVRDVRRFESADALKAYLGIYPRRRQSGKHEGRSHLAHHGHRLMRHMLWNAARAAVRVQHDGNPFRALYERLIAKHKSPPAAYAAVCRKLVQVIYGVLKSQKPFEYATSS